MKTCTLKLIRALGSLLLGASLAGCGDGNGGDAAGAKGRKPKNMAEFMAKAGADESSPPVMRVLALSPLLPDGAKKIATAELESEIDWIANHAPEGSETAVVDALECRPIASLKAGKGVSRIRKKALSKPVLAIKEFLSQSNSRAKSDGRVHLPHLTQTLAQLRLPAGTHVVVLGSPVFRNDGADKFFDMSDGRVPSDGMLFEDPKLSLFSVVDRARALQGQYWHLGYPGDEAFVDDTHRQGVQRFNALYIGEMGGTLVTHQPSFVAAMQAMRENRRDPLSQEKPDKDAAAEMVKVVKEIKQETREIEAKPKKESGDSLGEATDKGGLKEREEKREVAEADIKKPEAEMDEHGNPVGAEYDLGGKASLKGQRIMIVTFDHDPDVEGSPLPEALRTKGANVERVRYPLPQLAAWRTMLDKTDQLWLWSSEEVTHLPAEHLAALTQRWKAGKLGLCLLADNEPYVKEASRVLTSLIPGSRITGKYSGEKVLSARNGESGPGFDAANPLFTGLGHVYEGNTISTPSGKGLSTVCWASDGKPVLATYQTGDSSRLLVFGGYTSFYEQFWGKAGTARLATNMAAWLRADAASESGSSIASKDAE